MLIILELSLLLALSVDTVNRCPSWYLQFQSNSTGFFFFAFSHSIFPLSQWKLWSPINLPHLVICGAHKVFSELLHPHHYQKKNKRVNKSLRFLCSFFLYIRGYIVKALCSKNSCRCLKLVNFIEWIYFDKYKTI